MTEKNTNIIARALANEYIERHCHKLEDGSYEPLWRDRDGREITDSSGYKSIDANGRDIEYRTMSPQELTSFGIYSSVTEAEKHVIDLANTSYDEWPEYWQSQNTDAAKVLDMFLNIEGADKIVHLNLNDTTVQEEYGRVIHTYWLRRNPWSAGGPLSEDFAKLPVKEKQKDVDQLFLLQKLIKEKKLDIPMNYFAKNNELYFARIKAEAVIPSKKDEDAGYDIYACIDQPVVIHTGETVLVPTGVACAMSDDYYIQVEERSSIGSKGLKKSAGVIDSGYRGEIKIALTNATKHDFVLANSEEDLSSIRCNVSVLPKPEILYTSKAIAQLIVHRVHKMNAHEISYEDLQKIPSARGTGGFGSSGK